MGFAVCAYVDPHVTDMAVMGLNGIQLGDESLGAQRIPFLSGRIAQVRVPTQSLLVQRKSSTSLQSGTLKTA